MTSAGVFLVVRRHVDYRRVSSALCLPFGGN
ncbi:MAG: putative leader peptide [Haloechinothrix sp.]